MAKQTTMTSAIDIVSAIWLRLPPFCFPQVFDLNHGGPAAGLKMLQDRPSFRALGCGGDGTIGWILHEADKLHIRSCQLGVMPLGTGNDLARVLGWGASYSSPDLRSLSDYIDQVEKAKVTGLDR